MCGLYYSMIVLLLLNQNAVNSCPNECSCRLNYPGQGPVEEVECGSRDRPLMAVPVGIPTNASKLSLSYLNVPLISEEDFRGLSYMTYLSIHNSEINYVGSGTFGSLANLTRLFVTNGRITHIEPGAYRSQYLKELYLNDNLIRCLNKTNFQNIPQLNILSLHSNNISYIEPGTFRSLPNLKHLNLKSNNLAVIDIGIFRGLTKLTELHLDYNRISTLEPGVFQDSPDLEKLYLAVNPFCCSVSLCLAIRNVTMKIPHTMSGHAHCKTNSTSLDIGTDICNNKTIPGVPATCNVNSTTQQVPGTCYGYYVSVSTTPRPRVTSTAVALTSMMTVGMALAVGVLLSLILN